MHTRREIDNLLDKMNQIIEQNNLCNKAGHQDLVTAENATQLQEIKDQINKKTDNGKRVKGMWTNSPEFMSIK